MVIDRLDLSGCKMQLSCSLQTYTLYSPNTSICQYTQNIQHFGGSLHSQSLDWHWRRKTVQENTQTKHNQKKQKNTKYSRTKLPWFSHLLMTVGQEMRWAYSTMLPSSHRAKALGVQITWSLQMDQQFERVSVVADCPDSAPLLGGSLMRPTWLFHRRSPLPAQPCSALSATWSDQCWTTTQNNAPALSHIAGCPKYHL